MASTVPLSYIVQLVQESLQADMATAIERQLLEVVMPSIRAKAAEVATEVAKNASVTIERAYDQPSGFNFIVYFNGEVFNPKA